MYDVKEVTLLIPVRIDSLERTANLDALLHYISRFTDLRVLILEADEYRRYFPKEAYPQVAYRFMRDRDPIFYRTYYLNRLIEMAETPIVGIWDTDVIVPVGQIEEAVRQIREKKAVMSIPYSGKVYAVSPTYSDVFRADLDIDFLTRHIPDFPLALGSLSVGGAILVDKALYSKAGGENEHFYGWGPEDFERVKRMEKLQLPLYRAEGPLFHLYHPVGSNSQYANPSLERRNQAELFAIEKMDGIELQEYIRSWHSPHTLLPQIAEYLLVHSYTSSDVGLFYGKMGVVLFFFQYARYSGKMYYEDFAEDLLEIIYSRLHADMSLSFENGLCGIGWAIEYLVQSGFMRGDTAVLLKEFDDKIMERAPEKITDMSLETGLEGIACYVQARIKSSEENGKPFPFEAEYYARLKASLTRNEVPIHTHFRSVFEEIVNKVVPEREVKGWEVGLNNGCAGYGLKLLIS